MTPDQDLPEREQRVVDLLVQAGAQTRAPHQLRTRVADLQGRRAPRRPALVRWGASLAGTTAVVGAALAVALTSGAAAAPTVSQVAALAGRGPAGPAPGPLASDSTRLLTAAVGDLHFPNWAADGGWRSSGERTDTLSGRAVTTVYYTRAGTRLAYSIVAAPVLSGSRASNSPYAYLVKQLPSGRRVTIIWIVRGHTCELSGVGISADSLWRLAASTSTD